MWKERCYRNFNLFKFVVAVIASVLSFHSDNGYTFKDWPEVNAKTKEMPCCLRGASRPWTWLRLHAVKYRPYETVALLTGQICCTSFALILFSVLAPSGQLHQRSGIPFLTLSVHPTHLTLSGATWKHSISKLLLIPLSGKPQRLWFTL